MSWLKPLPRKDKPLPPVRPLPVPKRKGVAVLIVAAPTLAGLGLGVALAFVARRLGDFASGRLGEILTQTWVFALIVIWAFAVGVFVGFRTLMTVLAYGALEREGKAENVYNTDKPL